MPFIVGISLIGLGSLLVWGGISGRFGKMIAAVLPSNVSTTAAFNPPDTGFQQLALNGGGVVA